MNSRRNPNSAASSRRSRSASRSTTVMVRSLPAWAAFRAPICCSAARSGGSTAIASARATSCSRSGASTTTRSPIPSLPGRPCSSAATPSTALRTARWWRKSVRHPFGISPPRPRSATCSRATIRRRSPSGRPTHSRRSTRFATTGSCRTARESRRDSIKSRWATSCRSGRSDRIRSLPSRPNIARFCSISGAPSTGSACRA